MFYYECDVLRLPTPIYESLPYFYFIVSGFLVFRYDNNLMLMSAAVIYIVGAMTLVERSNYRRQDRRRKISGNWFLPELVYEYIPYVYIGVGILLTKESDSIWLRALAFMLLVLAVRNLSLRLVNRKKNSKFF